jgi:hypothetical protein
MCPWSHAFRPLEPTFDAMGSMGAQCLSGSIWGDADQDRRSGRQIIESAIAYCEWQAYKGHHGQLTRSQRENPSRWWYLDGLRLLTDILYSHFLDRDRYRFRRLRRISEFLEHQPLRCR